MRNDVWSTSGGPAFPLQVQTPMSLGGTMTETFKGMSLRDFFAAHALAGLLSVGSYSGAKCLAVAEDAYRYADAMLKAREA